MKFFGTFFLYFLNIFIFIIFFNNLVTSEKLILPSVDMGSDWEGGFYCPCHGSKFDLSGRVFSGFPAPANLRVPPHRYQDENTVIIGESEEIVNG